MLSAVSTFQYDVKEKPQLYKVVSAIGNTSTTVRDGAESLKYKKLSQQEGRARFSENL
jgi:hypothetical protein